MVLYEIVSDCRFLGEEKILSSLYAMKATLRVGMDTSICSHLGLYTHIPVIMNELNDLLSKINLSISHLPFQGHCSRNNS